jgi:hypothetical protein
MGMLMDSRSMLWLASQRRRACGGGGREAKPRRGLLAPVCLLTLPHTTPPLQPTPCRARTSERDLRQTYYAARLVRPGTADVLRAVVEPQHRGQD